MWDRFLRACRREPVDVTPVWFMRQAGRYMPEYRALRQKHTLLEICRQPELALEVTLQPLKMGMDAAILFADILLPLEPMGAPFEFAKGEGPVIHSPVRDRAAIEKLRVFDPEDGLGHILEAVKLIRRELDGKTPLIGFGGAPFTIASYLVEGGKSSDYRITKQMMWSDPASWSLLMSKISEVVRRYLRAQVAAGAQAIQLFDSWIGALSPQDYREHVMPHVKHILKDIEATGVPVIHFGTNTSTLLELQREAGGTVIGVDHRIQLADAWRRIGYDRAIQGNLDPLLLCAPPEVAAKRARSIIAEAEGRPGHIFNLGHGIIPEVPVDHVKAMVDVVHSVSLEMSAKKKVVVVGGGVTGLTVAYRLTRDPSRFDVTIVEPKARTGGNIETTRDGDFTIEAGPDSFVLTKPQARALCVELGLEDRLIGTIEANRKVYIGREGKLYSLPEGTVLGVPTRLGPLAASGLFSIAGKMRMSADLVIGRRHETGDESIGHFMRRRLGDEALDRLAEPMLAGIYMGDVDRLSLRATFPQLAALEAEHRSIIRGAQAMRKKRGEVKGEKPRSMFNSLVGGMGEMISALEKRAVEGGAVIRTRASVERVRALDDGRFEVDVRAHDGDTMLDADHVVMCAPAGPAAHMLRPIDDRLVTELRGIPYLSSGTVVLAYRRGAIEHALDATGILFPRTAGRSVLGITFVSSKWEHRAPDSHVLIRCYVGGHRDPEAINRTDEQLVALAVKDIREVLKATSEPERTLVFRFPSANVQPVLGHKERVVRINELASIYSGLHFCGAAFDGIGIPDCVRQAEEVSKKISG